MHPPNWRLVTISLNKERGANLMLRKWFGHTLIFGRFGSIVQGLAVLAVAAIAGCGSGDGLDRKLISGTVTCDGKPLPAGSILFEPDTYQSGTAVGGTILDGSFTIAQRDGPVPGSYKVRIYMSSGIQAPPAKGQTDRSPRPMVEFLPEQYNSKTKLRADVSASRPNRFQFDLSSLPTAGAQ
jgi:hypothetical protein